MAPIRRSNRRSPAGAHVRKNTVRLSADIAGRVRAGHPWVYREALPPRAFAPEPGTAIDVIDPDGEFVGRGLYDADSIIALRIFDRSPDVAIDGKLVRERVRAAVALRKRVADLDKLGCVRLVNAESDGLPGIVVERYGDYLVVQLYTNAIIACAGGALRDELLGATEGCAIDVAAKAHARARRNFAACGFDPEQPEHVVGDVFKVLARFVERGRKFDLVVIDPPAFASAAARGGKPWSAIRDYAELIAAALDVTAPGGMIAAASSTHKMSAADFELALADGAMIAGTRLQIIDRRGLPPDFPTVPGFPEGNYLKFAVAVRG